MEEEENEGEGEEEGEEREFSPRHNHVGITYIFITLSRTVFILDQTEGGKEGIVCVWVRGIRTSKEVFLLFFFFFWSL